jgi:hypothetical protein
VTGDALRRHDATGSSSRVAPTTACVIALIEAFLG